MTDPTKDTLNTIASILLRCWICGFLLLFIWLGVTQLAEMMKRMLDAGVERLYTDRLRSLLSLKAERLQLRAISN